MTIAAAEDWFVAVCQDLVSPNVKVLGGPYEFDGSFLKTLDTAAPTVVIVWDGANGAEDGTSVTLNAVWTIYAIAGWRGGDQATRRREAEVGAWALVTALAVHLHNRNMGERQFSISGDGRAVPNIPDPADLEGFGLVRLSNITNEGDGELDRVGVTLFAVEFRQELPLELPVDDTLKDWLRARFTFDIEGGEPAPDIPDVGTEGDLPGREDLPQT